MVKKDNKSKYKKATVGLIIAESITAFLLIVTAVFCAIGFSQKSTYAQALESNYQKNFYELVDNVNNAETKMSKVLVSGDSAYTKKLLLEISNNTSRASSNISQLPLSINGLSDAIIFINKVDGYTTSLAGKLEQGENLSSEEKQDLQKVYEAIKNIKGSLGEMSKKLYSGYSILDESLKIDGDFNNLTTTISTISTDIEYPTMIYDGPFSDSTLNVKIKGLNYDEISKETARAKIVELFSFVRDEDITDEDESNGKFQTYDFSLMTTTNQNMFVQVTKKGGKILNISSYADSTSREISLENAITIAVDFADKMEIPNLSCVWSDLVGNYAVLNLAPIINKAIIYADLVKVKVDLTEGYIIGFDASSYYTNHIERTVSSASLGATTAREKISSDFEIQSQKLSLSPLDYNREVLCYEFKCKKDGAIYYIYINANTGNEENILKVVETSKNGNLLV